MKNYEIEWLVEDHVILIKSYHIDMSSLEDMIQEVHGMVEMSERPLVHTIWDTLDQNVYPKQINKIFEIVKPMLTNERFGWMLVLVENPMIKFLSQVGTSPFRVRYRTFNNLDEAMIFLQERDVTLPGQN